MDDIEEIKNRNRRVELDKAWETSHTRRMIIVVLTYVCASIWLIKIGNDQPFQNAFVPVGGYVLSTWSLPFVRMWWTKKQKQQ